MIYYCAVLHKKKALSGAVSTLNRHIEFLASEMQLMFMYHGSFRNILFGPEGLQHADSRVLRIKRLGKNKNTSLKSLDLKLILLYSHIGISLELSVPDP